MKCQPASISGDAGPPENHSGTLMILYLQTQLTADTSMLSLSHTRILTWERDGIEVQLHFYCSTCRITPVLFLVCK